jgi:hypothetical protein
MEVIYMSGKSNKPKVVDRYTQFVSHVVHVETFWTMKEAEVWAAEYEKRYGTPISAEELHRDGRKLIEESDYL